MDTTPPIKRDNLKTPHSLFIAPYWIITMIGDITMKPNEIMLYNTSVAEVQELFYMNSRKDFAEINFNRYDVKLSKLTKRP